MYPNILLLSTVASAASAFTIPSFFNIGHFGCGGLDNITFNAGALPPPTGYQLYHIAIGRGTQNYTCDPAGGATAVPAAIGAVATLYNATCLAGILGTNTVDQLTNFAGKQSRGVPIPEVVESGHHYFSDTTTPTFNLHTANANYGIDFAKKANAVAAPAGAPTSQDGSAAVTWLQLKVELPPLPPYSLDAADSASNVALVYRVNTVGGSAPATCADHVGKTFTQEYAAEYWFWN